MDQNPSSSKPDRKTVEKNRRYQMKSLCSKLSSIVPPQSHTVHTVSLLDQLEVATNYIKKLELNLEKIKQKKNWLMGSSNGGFKPLEIDVNLMGSVLEVILMTGFNCQFLFRETIRMLQEENAEIANASFTVQENAIFHTIHCQIEGSTPEHGATRIAERLRKFVARVDL
ncbi:transcription factor bHLH162-like isoform X1 [Primulina tabacum]|uniref:transcription factor bHLH162-like isoform X1 n=1 Tax=Primulina tabacum TaxID=48773 RepID=UPI003F5A2491